MATSKKPRLTTPAGKENAILKKIFLVTLDYDDADDSRFVYMETTAAEMLSEGKDTRLCRESMERVLVDRLSGDFMVAEPPFQYLLGCFRRAAEEEVKIKKIADVYVRSEIEMAVKQAKNLSVSYCKIHLENPGMFPSTDSGNDSGLLQMKLSDVSILSGFLSQFFEEEKDYETMKPIYNQFFEDLRSNVVRVSALGEFQKPFMVFLELIQKPVGERVLVDHLLNGVSNLKGRGIEMNNVVGAFFHVSALPDHTFKSLPDVGEQGLSNTTLAATVRTFMNSLQDGLSNALMTLLKKNVFRDNVMKYLAEVINKNASRAHIEFDELSCASSGTFVNLSAVMLRLCDPFLNDMKLRTKIDPRYVLNSRRLELRGLTPLHAPTSDDQVSVNPNLEFGFISECFFMTARVLNLGLMKTLSHVRHLYETVRTCETELSELKANQDSRSSPHIAKLEKEIQSNKREIWCHEAQVLNDKTLLQRALSFYRLMAVWMVDLAGGFKIPAPETFPAHFAAIPEHFVDDAMEFLIFTLQWGAFDHFEGTEFVNFIIMFMGRSDYVRNPYLRTKMVEVLNCLIPYEDRNLLMRGHRPVLDHLVRNLLHLYAEIESAGQFYDRFNVRHSISKLLEYLWEIPGHRDAWRKIAKVEEKGLYLQFLNFLINDSIYLLDEGLKDLMKLELDSNAEINVKANMILANEDIDMIRYTSEEIVAPFLVPEMVERVAGMLNYFLSQLVAMFRRNSPALNEPEKYAFRPKDLLRMIVKIYVNLDRQDKQNVFAVAITKDGRSYSEELFNAAAEELRKNGEDSSIVRGFMELGRKAKVVTRMAEEAEMALGEIPEEFLDPIVSTLMTDPVILPNTNVRMDRPVILRHLLSKKTDPFSGLHLTADMLIPDTELKAKIDRFLQT